MPPSYMFPTRPPALPLCPRAAAPPRMAAAAGFRKVAVADPRWNGPVDMVFG